MCLILKREVKNVLCIAFIIEKYISILSIEVVNMSEVVKNTVNILL